MDKKITYTIIGLSLAGGAYLLYKYWNNIEEFIRSRFVVPTSPTPIVTTPSTVSNPSQPVSVPTNLGYLIYTTNVAPYSTISYRFALNRLPFDITIKVAWTGDQSINVSIVPYLYIQEVNIYGFGLLIHSFTYNPPILVQFRPLTATISPNNEVNIPLSVNLSDYLNVSGMSMRDLLIMLQILGMLTAGSIIMKGIFGFKVYANGTYVGEYQENLTLKYSAL